MRRPVKNIWLRLHNCLIPLMMELEQEKEQEFKPIIEGIVCPVHKKHPVFFMEDGKIKLTCCCDEFMLQCFYILRKLSTNR